jgi:AraC-like DNA-binding protein
VQKRPSGPYRLEYAPIRLGGDFPIMVGAGVHRQEDAPITRLHLHDCLEIGYCHAGSGVFVVEDKVLLFREGDLCVINDREMHRAQSARGTISEWTFVMVDPPRLLGSVAEGSDALGIGSLGGPKFQNVVPGAEHPALVGLVKTLMEELRGKRTGYRSAVRALVWAILTLLHRLPGVAATATLPVRRRDMERVAPALDCLATRHGTPIRMAELAGRCHMSLTHFRRVFGQAVGMSPARYLARLRIRMAAALLRGTDRKALDIALEVGYPTLSSFNRQFRAVMGMAPRDWRRRGS